MAFGGIKKVMLELQSFFLSHNALAMHCFLSFRPSPLVLILPWRLYRNVKYSKLQSFEAE